MTSEHGDKASYSIFHEPWWWETLVPGKWDEVVVRRDGRVAARLPFVKSRESLGLIMLGGPPLTKWTGPWISDSEARLTRRLSRTKELLTELLAQLPRHHYFLQNLHPEVEYWLPFHWAGFDMTPRITYRLPNTEPSALQAAYDTSIRTDIRKAAKQVEIVRDSNAENLIAAMRATYERQGRALPVSDSLIARLVGEVLSRGRGEVLSAFDADRRLHASSFFIHDERSTYYLLGGGHPDLRKSGANTLLLSRGIETAMAQGREFDFEGSMVEPIERFFRAFGAVPTEYLAARRATGVVAALRGIRTAFSGLRKSRG